VTADSDLQCPTCRTVSWTRDGFVMTANPNGELLRIRVSPSSAESSTAGPWYCPGCGHAVKDGSDLSRTLDGLQIAHLE
jgi:rubredoxin